MYFPAAVWIENLRSGKYVQGFGFLHKTNLYCPIGVACETYIQIESDLNITKCVDDIYLYDGYSIHMPSKVRSWLRLQTSFTHDLELYNDIDKKSFTEISYIIEEYYEQT